MTAASRPDWFGDHTTAARSSRVPSGAVVGVVVGRARRVSGDHHHRRAADLGRLRRRRPSTGARGASAASSRVRRAGAGRSARAEHPDRPHRLGRAGAPGDPYVVHPDPLTLDGVFDFYFWAAATAPPALRRPARLVLDDSARPAGRRVVTGELESDGRLVVDQLSHSFFDGHPVEVGQLNGADHAIDGHPGMLFTAAVHYCGAEPAQPARHGVGPAGPAGRRLGGRRRHDRCRTTPTQQWPGRPRTPCVR